MSGEERANNITKKDVSLTSECLVCGGPAASHQHYGAISCYSCRAFFRRAILRKDAFTCSRQEGLCVITSSTRTNCKKCRLLRCLDAGMMPERVDVTLKKNRDAGQDGGGGVSTSAAGQSGEQVVAGGDGQQFFVEYREPYVTSAHGNLAGQVIHTTGGQPILIQRQEPGVGISIPTCSSQMAGGNELPFAAIPVSMVGNSTYLASNSIVQVLPGPGRVEVVPAVSSITQEAGNSVRGKNSRRRNNGVTARGSRSIRLSEASTNIPASVIGLQRSIVLNPESGLDPLLLPNVMNHHIVNATQHSSSVELAIPEPAANFEVISAQPVRQQTYYLFDQESQTFQPVTVAEFMEQPVHEEEVVTEGELIPAEQQGEVFIEEIPEDQFILPHNPPQATGVAVEGMRPLDSLAAVASVIEGRAVPAPVTEVNHHGDVYQIQQIVCEEVAAPEARGVKTVEIAYNPMVVRDMGMERSSSVPTVRLESSRPTVKFDEHNEDHRIIQDYIRLQQRSLDMPNSVQPHVSETVVPKSDVENHREEKPKIADGKDKGAKVKIDIEELVDLCFEEERLKKEKEKNSMAAASLIDTKPVLAVRPLIRPNAGSQGANSLPQLPTIQGQNCISTTGTGQGVGPLAGNHNTTDGLTHYSTAGPFKLLTSAIPAVKREAVDGAPQLAVTGMPGVTGSVGGGGGIGQPTSSATPRQVVSSCPTLLAKRTIPIISNSGAVTVSSPAKSEAGAASVMTTDQPQGLDLSLRGSSQPSPRRNFSVIQTVDAKTGVINNRLPLIATTTTVTQMTPTKPPGLATSLPAVLSVKSPPVIPASTTIPCLTTASTVNQAVLVVNSTTNAGLKIQSNNLTVAAASTAAGNSNEAQQKKIIQNNGIAIQQFARVDPLEGNISAAKASSPSEVSQRRSPRASSGTGSSQTSSSRTKRKLDVSPAASSRTQISERPIKKACLSVGEKTASSDPDSNSNDDLMERLVEDVWMNEARIHSNGLKSGVKAETVKVHLKDEVPEDEVEQTGKPERLWWPFDLLVNWTSEEDFLLINLRKDLMYSLSDNSDHQLILSPDIKAIDYVTIGLGLRQAVLKVVTKIQTLRSLFDGQTDDKRLEFCCSQLPVLMSILLKSLNRSGDRQEDRMACHRALEQGQSMLKQKFISALKETKYSHLSDLWSDAAKHCIEDSGVAVLLLISVLSSTKVCGGHDIVSSDLYDYQHHLYRFIYRYLSSKHVPEDDNKDDLDHMRLAANDAHHLAGIVYCPIEN